MASQVLRWSGPKGGHIGVGFDDDFFGLEAMRAEIAFISEALPSLPDEVPQGTSFVFVKDGTGHLLARFRVGNTVYQNASEGDLHHLWKTVRYIESLLHPRHEQKAAS